MEHIEALAERLRALRLGSKLSQEKIAEKIGTTQSAINRYETSIASPQLKTLLWYADYFDVSLDYIFGRTDNPQGKLYEYTPRVAENSEELRQFIEMCFDPSSPMNGKLKDTLMQMMTGGDGK